LEIWQLFLSVVSTLQVLNSNSRHLVLLYFKLLEAYWSGDMM